jgi:hypothetical protein
MNWKYLVFISLAIVTLAACGIKEEPMLVNTVESGKKSLNCRVTNFNSELIQICEVGILRLVSNPEYYEGRTIRTNAYLVKIFDEYALTYTQDRNMIFRGQDSIAIESSIVDSIPLRLRQQVEDHNAVAVDVVGTIQFGEVGLERSVSYVSNIKMLIGAANDVRLPPPPPRPAKQKAKT